MLSIILSTLTLFVVLFLLFLVVLPLKKVNSYKADRVTTYFFPVIGFFNYINKALKETNDVMANSKELHSVGSRPKYLVTNSSANVLIFLKDPQYIKEFLQRPNLYHKSKITKSLAPLTGAGLLIAEDDVWKRHRKIVSTSFHFDFLKANVSTMKNTAVEFFEKVQPNEYQNYPAISKVQEITGEIVGRMFFGENLNSYNFEGKTLTLALAEITSELAIQRMTAPVLIFGPKVLEIPLFPTYRKIMQKVKRFRKACSDIIQDRKSKPQANSSDLLSSLLATQQLPDPELRFSDEDIVSEFITFFIAGMDTTGHLIAMALYNLTQHPQYLPQLEAERQKLYNTKGQELTTEALAGMEQLHAFLKETLRFYTPAPFTFVRQAMFDHEIVDLKIKKGDLVFPDLLSSAYDEKNFEKPLEFNPARWLGANTKLDPYAFIPFSAGPRNCIGQHLAMMEAKVIVSEFLERYDFSLQEGYKLRMRIRLLYEPEEEIFLNLSRKS